MDDAVKMMTHWGFGERLKDVLAAGIVRFEVKGSDAEITEKIEALVDILLEKLGREIRLNESPQASDASGALVGGVVRGLLVNGCHPQAIALARRLMHAAKQAGDKVAVVAIASHSTEPLNTFEEYDAARDLIADAADFNGGLSGVEPDLALRFLVEMGNCARYAHIYANALEMYEGARGILQFTAEGEMRERNADVLLLNVAIVLRGLRRYGEALSTLETLVAKRPDHADGQHSLAVLHALTGNTAAALSHLDRAIVLTAGGPRTQERASLLVSRGHIRRLLNLDDDALRDCAAVLALPVAKSVQVRAACVAALCRPSTEPGCKTQDEAVAAIRRYLDATRDAPVSDRRGTALGSMAEFLLRQGRVAEAGKLLNGSVPRWRAANVRLPWEIDAVEGWLAHIAGQDERSWQHLQSAMARVDHEVPHGDDARFAAGWLHDKGELQARTAQVGIRCVRGGSASARELLRVYEFINGRELSARLGAERATQLDVSAGLAKVQRAVECFLFIDAGAEIGLVRVGCGGVEVELIEMPTLSATDLAAVRTATLLAFKRANPADLGPHDRNMGPWKDLAARIGAAIASHVRAGVHVCFLPGRLLTGLPLHTLPLPDGKCLLEHVTVSYAANFATLLAPPRGTRSELAGLVLMPKQEERPKFVENAQHIQGRLAEQLRQRFAKVESIQGPAKGKRDALDLLGRAEEVVLLCHGYDGGPEHGFGICVAADGRPPPPLLAVERAAELRDFMITWPDLEALHSAPSVVVSIGCSTGMTVIGTAGVRYGLEQTAFAAGTRALVSPLWDVDQTASHAWLEHFYTARNVYGMDLMQACRAASLRLKSERSHAYFWAPFVLNGSIM